MRICPVGYIKKRVPGGKVGGRERDGQRSDRRPSFGRVIVDARRSFLGIGVVIETATHFQQLDDGDLVAVGHACDVLRYRIVPRVGFLPKGCSRPSPARRNLRALYS